MTQPSRGASRRLVLFGAGLLIAAGAIATTAAGTGRRDGVSQGVALAPRLARTQAPPPGGLRHPGVIAAAADVRAAGRPIRLAIPSIGVNTALQPLHLLADGSLEAPARWARAGWFADGVRPGQVGPAVIAGHIDSTSGPAVFFRLHALRPGDSVLVRMRDGRVLTFSVDGLRRYPKARFPTGAVYGPTPDPQLRLVTCIGAFDPQSGSYLDNLVVSAHYVAGHPALGPAQPPSWRSSNGAYPGPSASSVSG